MICHLTTVSPVKVVRKIVFFFTDRPKLASTYIRFERIGRFWSDFSRGCLTSGSVSPASAAPPEPPVRKIVFFFTVRPKLVSTYIGFERIGAFRSDFSRGSLHTGVSQQHSPVTTHHCQTQKMVITSPCS